KSAVGSGNHRLEVKGLFKGKLSFENKKTEQDIYVVGGLAKPLLGLPALKAPALIKRVHAIQCQQDDFKELYPTVFSDLEKLKEPYKLELEPGAVPYALSTPRRVPLSLQDKVRAELNRMEGMGVISKVTKPTPWCAGLVVAPKAQPGEIRFCVDLTHLNKWVRRERHILPAVDHTLAMLSGAKVFTKLNATSGFWQIGAALGWSPRALPESHVTDAGGLVKVLYVTQTTDCCVWIGYAASQRKTAQGPTEAKRRRTNVSLLKIALCLWGTE
ncbi:hypothetical protein NFI96_026601, partial [Prochilodus magdalenae]